MNLALALRALIGLVTELLRQKRTRRWGELREVVRRAKDAKTREEKIAAARDLERASGAGSDDDAPGLRD